MLPKMPHTSATQASSWVRRFLPLIPKNQGPVLDLACGAGRHTRLLLDAGYEVWALDKDAALLEPLEALGARCFQVDLESAVEANELTESMNWPFEAGLFAGVIVTNYLYRPLLPNLTDSLKNQGILIYETFALGNEAFGRPKNPNFLLRPGELIQAFLSDSEGARKNHCISYENGYVEYPYPALIQRICLRSLLANAPVDVASDTLD
jgi:SAM-dependent methyltransferase